MAGVAAALQSPPPTRHLPALSYYTFYLLLNQFHINSTSSSSKSAHIILQEDSSGLSLDKQANNDVAAFSVLVPLVIWDYCKRWPPRNRISSFFSGPRKPQLYNWHFHSPRSCRVVTGTRARLNGVEKRSASLDTCCSYCFLLLSFILPFYFSTSTLCGCISSWVFIRKGGEGVSIQNDSLIENWVFSQNTCNQTACCDQLK